MSKHPPMGSMSCWPQWAIPGVGLLWPCFDRVQIVSSESVGALKARLPVAQLKRACHSFNVLTYQGRDPRLQSRIVIVGTRNAKPWLILAHHEAILGRYRVTQAEVAFDAHAHSIADVSEKFFALTVAAVQRSHRTAVCFIATTPNYCELMSFTFVCGRKDCGSRQSLGAHNRWRGRPEKHFLAASMWRALGEAHRKH